MTWVPGEATFNLPVTVILTYNPSQLPREVRPESLYIASLEKTSSEWIKEKSAVNVTANTVSVLVSHFGMYTLMAPPVTPLVIPPSSKVTSQVKPDQDNEIKSADERIVIKIPEGATSKSIDIELINEVPGGSAEMQMVSLFELNAYDSQSKEKVSQFNKELQITIQHNPKELAGLNIESLRLYYLDDQSRQWLP